MSGLAFLCRRTMLVSIMEYVQLQELIGRQKVLEGLLQWLREGRKLNKRNVQEGFQAVDFPHALLLQGEAGMGKTRLARQLALLAGELNWEVIWASGSQTQQQDFFSYRTWRELLRGIKWTNRVPKVLRENLSIYRPLAAILPERFGWLAWNERLEPEPSHIYDAVLRYLIEISFRRPLLLILDNIHQVDEPSLNLLAYVVRRLSHEHVLMFLTSNSCAADTPLWTLQRHLLSERVLMQMWLEPLTNEQIGCLVPSTTGERQQAWTQFLQKWSGGNPGFALDLLLFLENGLLTTESKIPLLPHSVTNSLKAQLDSVSLLTRELLERMATLGNPCLLHILLKSSLIENHNRGILSEDKFFELLEEACSQGLLLEERTEDNIQYRYRHPLLQVYLLQKHIIDHEDILSFLN